MSEPMSYEAALAQAQEYLEKGCQCSTSVAARILQEVADHILKGDWPVEITPQIFGFIAARSVYINGHSQQREDAFLSGVNAGLASHNIC